MSFVARLDLLPAAQRTLWRELASVPHRFVLYGGTALALRLAHRASIDFDFFTSDPLDHRELDGVPFLRDAIVLQDQPNTRTVLVSRGDDVKVSFFGGLPFGRVGEPEETSDGIVRAASLIDLGGTKIKALLQRVEAKDYLDIIALLDHGVPLEDILGAAKALFGPAFDPLVAQKALCYFEGGDLNTLDASVRDRLIKAAARDVTPTDLAPRSPRLAP